MNTRGWFTLLVRGAGLSYVLTSGLSLVYYVVKSLFFAAGTGATAGMSPEGFDPRMPIFPDMAVHLLWPAMNVGLGLYLLLGCSWLIDRLCREVHNRCVPCGHALTHGQVTCPECGEPTGDNRPAGGPNMPA